VRVAQPPELPDSNSQPDYKSFSPKPNRFLIRIGNYLLTNYGAYEIPEDEAEISELLAKLAEFSTEEITTAIKTNYLKPTATFEIVSYVARLLESNSVDSGKRIKPIADIYFAKPILKALTTYVIVDRSFRGLKVDEPVSLKPLSEAEVTSLLTINKREGYKLAHTFERAFSLKFKKENGKKEEDPEIKFKKTIDYLVKNGLVYEVCNKVIDISFLNKLDWKREIVDRILSLGAEKDARIIEVQRAHLIKSLNAEFSPHTILATNPGTGKTSFYLHTGINVDKVTENSFLGWARSKDEIYVGLVNGSTLTINIDEFQSAPYNVASKINNILEYGKAEVWSAAIKFTVKSSSTFVFSANPVGFANDPAKSFGALLNRLTLNGPALGRRIAFIVYGTDFKTISKKLTTEEERTLEALVFLFRVVEEYAQNKIKKILREAENWLNQPIPSYAEKIKELLQDFPAGAEHDFILNHALATAKIRAGALYAVIADRLADIALDKITTEELIDEAEDRLPIYIKINLESINRISKVWKDIELEGAKFFYEVEAPSFFKVILEACEFEKRQNPNVQQVVVNDLNYENNNVYVSTAVAKLRSRSSKRISELLDAALKHFGFAFAFRDNKLVCEYLKNQNNDVIKVKPQQKTILSQSDGQVDTMDKMDNSILVVFFNRLVFFSGIFVYFLSFWCIFWFIIYLFIFNNFFVR